MQQAVEVEPTSHMPRVQQVVQAEIAVVLQHQTAVPEQTHLQRQRIQLRIQVQAVVDQVGLPRQTWSVETEHQVLLLFAM